MQFLSQNHRNSLKSATLRIRYTKVSWLSTISVSHQSLVGPFVCCPSVCQLSPRLSSLSVFLSARWSVEGWTTQAACTVRQSFSRSFSRSQSVSESVSRSQCQSVGHSVSRPVSQSASQSDRQKDSRSVSHSFNQAVSQSDSQLYNYLVRQYNQTKVWIQGCAPNIKWTDVISILTKRTGVKGSSILSA